MASILERAETNTALVHEQLHTGEAFVLDFARLKSGQNRRELLEVIEKAAPTGFLHIVNHGLDPKLFQTLRKVTYDVMTATMEEKDRDTAVEGTGSFEGYKPRTPEEIRQGILPGIEEYNYDYNSPGTITRPKVIQENEISIRTVFDFYHSELTPALLSLLGDYCDLDLIEGHTKATEVAHFLLYHPHWYNDTDKKRAAYGGHTDIGSLTYLNCNPVAGLQIYGPNGWVYAAYVENSIVVNAGDALEYMTGGKINATLHRVIKPVHGQKNDPRPAIPFFVHPNHDVMVASLQATKERRERLTAESRAKPGHPVDSIGLNRIISALSIQREDIYLEAIDGQAWLAAKRKGLVNSPPGVVINYHNLALSRPFSI
ncbi:hypothetical protein N0V93_006005 [Gnomoniopsis smithogilvyi]|uniref:Fe2OG dioxygenase domain-containing protein n=1 Tax=Gnomoniopsis smithogilvyi TaxID=1191159 RepID=A0A9W8YNV8_9PEZI|nr:hypothetical protein N0V93_006005 [Gnomoniopsis smithogilvyi]